MKVSRPVRYFTSKDTQCFAPPERESRRKFVQLFCRSRLCLKIERVLNHSGHWRVWSNILYDLIGRFKQPRVRGQAKNGPTGDEVFVWTFTPSPCLQSPAKPMKNFHSRFKVLRTPQTLEQRLGRVGNRIVREELPGWSSDELVNSRLGATLTGQAANLSTFGSCGTASAVVASNAT